MIGISDSSVTIQVSSQFVPSTPAWFEERQGSLVIGMCHDVFAPPDVQPNEREERLAQSLLVT